LGHIYQGHPGQHIRILHYGHYRIAYLIKPDEDLDILGVFHGALDLSRYLL
jgi:plasmid stabilization system protein ParE